MRSPRFQHLFPTSLDFAATLPPAEELNDARLIEWVVYKLRLELARAAAAGVPPALHLPEGLPTIAFMQGYNQAAHAAALAQLQAAMNAFMPVPYPQQPVACWWATAQAHAAAGLLAPGIGDNAAILPPAGFGRAQANAITGYNI